MYLGICLKAEKEEYRLWNWKQPSKIIFVNFPVYGNRKTLVPIVIKIKIKAFHHFLFPYLLYFFNLFRSQIWGSGRFIWDTSFQEENKYFSPTNINYSYSSSIAFYEGEILNFFCHMLFAFNGTFSMFLIGFQVSLWEREWYIFVCIWQEEKSYKHEKVENAIWEQRHMSMGVLTETGLKEKCKRGWHKNSKLNADFCSIYWETFLHCFL